MPEEKIELRPCPFCGKEPEFWPDTEGIYSDGKGHVRCRTIDCAIGCETDWILTTAWNTRADGWQPIETSPKDGTTVLLFRKNKVVMGYWDDQKHHTKPKPYWASIGFAHNIIGDRANPPTLWMPLPQPPQTLTQIEKE